MEKEWFKFSFQWHIFQLIVKVKMKMKSDCIDGCELAIVWDRLYKVSVVGFCEFDMRCHQLCDCWVCVLSNYWNFWNKDTRWFAKRGGTSLRKKLQSCVAGNVGSSSHKGIYFPSAVVQGYSCDCNSNADNNSGVKPRLKLCILLSLSLRCWLKKSHPKRNCHPLHRVTTPH